MKGVMCLSSELADVRQRDLQARVWVARDTAVLKLRLTEVLGLYAGLRSQDSSVPRLRALLDAAAEGPRAERPRAWGCLGQSPSMATQCKQERGDVYFL